MRSKSILNGINVPVAPVSSCEATLTNNITISTSSPEATTTITSRSTSETQTDKVVNDKQEIPKINENFNEYLLQLYQTILLSDNKKLITNVIFKDSIVLTQEDLEKVIECKIGKTVKISYEDPEITCCGNNINPIMKISSIRIDGANPSDFKIVYNKEYLELLTKYHLNLKYVLVN